MNTDRPEEFEALVLRAASREPLGQDPESGPWVREALAPGAAMYKNVNDRLGIDFAVDRLAFPDLQVMDPRVVRIAPGKRNEFHKHAHESLFVVLEGEGEVRIGERTLPVKQGDVAFVPRWIFHQSCNTSTERELVILAITDFGFTSALLGDYDRRTRQAQGGDDTRDG
ncbi:MAG: cupin domain-containing protein [Deltaproteobacteria bacterium]|nr:cupin domain-containing protein [Deltaproteobacteria bacterium]